MRLLRSSWLLLFWIAFPWNSTAADKPATEEFDPEPVVSLFELLVDSAETSPDTARECLSVLAGKVQSGEIADKALESLRPRLQPIMAKLIAKRDHPLYLDAVLLSASWDDPAGVAAARTVLESTKEVESRRLAALDALVSAGDKSVTGVVSALLADKANSASLRSAALAALGRSDHQQIADIVLAAYSKLESDLQPKAIELLTQRPAWSKALLNAIGRNEIAPTVLNANQVRKLLGSRDEELVKLVALKWGTIRTDRNPQREQTIADARALLRRTPGDAHRGEKVFSNLCAQCHKMHGAGHEVGPDLTNNGRSSFDQLLSNVFDPSLVIGGSYQARTVITNDGRSLTGLLAEDNEQRVVLKTQGGKTETIARDDVDEIVISQLSLMPEEIEKQLKPHEIADLFAFLMLDKHPSDPAARRLPGLDEPVFRTTEEPAQFGALIAEVASGFLCAASGDGGLALLKEYQKKPTVLRTHPVNQTTPCILRSTVQLPAGKKSRLLLQVTHDTSGDWQLLVKANGKTIHDGIVGPKTVKNGWLELSLDLSSLAGSKAELELHNIANDWNYEHGYWRKVEIVSE